MLYEDGNQTRDFSFVEDIARANLLAATTDKLDGLPVNVGSGKAAMIREIAQLISDALEIPIEPIAQGEFRPARCATSHLTRLASVLSGMNRKWIWPAGSDAILIGFARRRMCASTSRKLRIFCGPKASCIRSIPGKSITHERTNRCREDAPSG